MENVRQNELDGILDDFISRNALEEYGEKSLVAYEAEAHGYKNHLEA